MSKSHQLWLGFSERLLHVWNNQIMQIDRYFLFKLIVNYD